MKNKSSGATEQLKYKWIFRNVRIGRLLNTLHTRQRSILNNDQRHQCPRRRRRPLARPADDRLDHRCLDWAAGQRFREIADFTTFGPERLSIARQASNMAIPSGCDRRDTPFSTRRNH